MPPNKSMEATRPTAAKRMQDPIPTAGRRPSPGGAGAGGALRRGAARGRAAREGGRRPSPRGATRRGPEPRGVGQRAGGRPARAGSARSRRARGRRAGRRAPSASRRAAAGVAGRAAEARAVGQLGSQPLGSASLGEASTSMELARRLIAPVARVTGRSSVEVDLEAFVFRLLLFDHYVIASIRLLELPALLSAFSYDGLVRLLRSGAISIDCFPVHTGSLGPSLFVEEVPPGTIRPPFHYSLATVSLPNPLHHVNLCLAELEARLPLRKRQAVGLRRAIYECLTAVEHEAGEMALRSTGQELPQSPDILAHMCSLAAKKKFGIILDPADIQVTATRVTDNDYSVENNLEQAFPLGQHDAHTIIESGILAIAQRNDRIEQMKRYSALSGFSNDDLPVFGRRLDFIEASLSPTSQERRVRRILELRGLPRIRSDQPVSIDARRLLELRDSAECQEFRRWLSSSDDISDDLIRTLSRSLESRIGGFIRSGSGRVLRFLTTSGLGLVPVGGQIASTLLSAADQFLLEKVFPAPGPIAFIDRAYPSLFERHE